MASAGILGLGWASCGGESAARLGSAAWRWTVFRTSSACWRRSKTAVCRRPIFLELSACTQGLRRGLLQCGESLRGQASHQGPAQGSAGLPQPFPLSWRGAGYCAEGQGATVLTCLRAGSGPGDGHQQTVAYPGVGVPPARPPLRLLRSALLPGLRGGRVLGRASEDDCIFKVRERMRSMAGSKEEADDYLPRPFRRQEPSE